jgi:hypothetical protein
MQTITIEKLKEVDVLLTEIKTLNGLIPDSEEAVAEEMRQERMALIVRVNNIYGTEYIMPDSKASTINNDLYND